MESLTTYDILLTLCGLVVLSYFFNIINRLTRIPSVLLLLGAGIFFRYLSETTGLPFYVPHTVVELLGTVGLIMIVLEAGLDLTITRDKLHLIRSSLLSALIIFVISTLAISGILYWWIPSTPFINCLVYAIPLSIVSSAVVLPSVRHLGHEKKEFLIYEASFSDIIGILAFNFFTSNTDIGGKDVAWFGGSILIALVLSIIICLGLMWLLVRNRAGIKFFLSFAVLIIIYVSGKLLHLPSLITILMFGLVINNWDLISWKPIKAYFSDENVEGEAIFLKSITAESSFLIRTFFFIIFGFGIDLAIFQNIQVLQVGSLITLALVALRFIYLKVMHQNKQVLPELFYIPRGLITVLLFYKIPDWLRIESFDEGILFFVILATGIFLMIGTMLFRDRPVVIKGIDESSEEEF